jgi:two-component system, chemotaxis family, sensor kinase CheA
MTDEIVREFLVECNENLDALDRELVELEKDPRNRATLASVFRTIHTIKGACGFLGFSKLEAVAHVGENLLSRLRDGELLLNSEIATALLQMVDAVRQMMRSIEAVGNEGERNDEELIKLLTSVHHGAPEPVANFIADATAPSKNAKPNKERQAAPATSPVLETVLPVEATETLQSQQESNENVAQGSIRVDVALLDELMNLVGELVLARNQVLQFSNAADDPAIVAPSQRLNLITAELQANVMRTRMQPIGTIWSRFPRTVRDVATSCGKQVRIEMFGQETELDKTIIEAIKDPLTHLVRNSVDHGIERPEARVAAGKPAEGCLTLRAFHEGGQVNIEITDDGAGLDQEKIRRKAVERGLQSTEKAAQLTEREVLNLIFLPGFSTADKITNVSGRGVGMDVVKTNIEKIGGTVDVESAVGVGTTVKTKIPLTLAIIPGLVVCSGGERFVIPQVSLIELVLIGGDSWHTGIEMAYGAPVYRLRGRLLPVLYMDRELGIQKQFKNKFASDAAADCAVNMVVLQTDGRQFGLVVDEIKDTEEIVVKPLDRRLKSLKTFAGATIMGDGLVALILDVQGLAQRAGIVSETHDRAASPASFENHEAGNETQTFLVFAGPDDARMAVPLASLTRLETFACAQVERSGAESVIQYRGNILPLVYLNAALDHRGNSARRPQTATAEMEADSIQVLVCNHQQHAVGLVVDRIVDIVEACARIKSPATRNGVLCAAVIQNRVTELLDLDVILSAPYAAQLREKQSVPVGD